MESIEGKPFQLTKGIHSSLALLPASQDLSSSKAENMVEPCIVYGNAMNLFLKKEKQATFIRQVLQASFMKLMLEFLSIFSLNRLNVWNFSVMPFSAESFGLKLHDIVDTVIEEWR